MQTKNLKRTKRKSLKRKPEKLTVAQYLLKRLASFDVCHLFGLNHPHLERLHSYCQQHSKIRYIEAASGPLAANMAEGYAKAQGFAACAMATNTTGFIEAIGRAHHESVPLAIILGTENQMPRKLYSGIEKGLKELVACWTILDDVKVAAKKIDKALDTARHFQLPVCIELPQEVADLVIPIHRSVEFDFGAKPPRKITRERAIHSKLITAINKKLEKIDCGVVCSPSLYLLAKSLDHATRIISTKILFTPSYAMEAAIGTSLAKPDETLLVFIRESELHSSFEALGLLQKLCNHVIICLFSNKTKMEELFEAESYSWNLTELAHLFVDGNAIQVHLQKDFEAALRQALEMPSGLFLIETDLIP